MTLTLLALFLALFTLASALPTTAPIVVRRAIVAKAPVLSTAPRSLLGRYYLRHNLAININTNTFPKPAAALLPPDTGDFAGRADRFQVLQRRRAARTVKLPVHREDASQGDNNLLSNYTIAASPAPAKWSPTVGAVRVSTHVQAPLATPTPPASAPRPAHGRTGTLKHHGLKKAVAAKQVALL